MRPLVQPDAGYSGDLPVNARVVMSEEAHPRLGEREEVIEPSSLADEASTSSVPFELNASGCIVSEDDVQVRARAQRVDLFASVMALGVALESSGRSPEVGRAEAAADATDAEHLVGRRRVGSAGRGA